MKTEKEREKVVYEAAQFAHAAGGQTETVIAGLIALVSSLESDLDIAKMIIAQGTRLETYTMANARKRKMLCMRFFRSTPELNFYRQKAGLAAEVLERTRPDAGSPGESDGGSTVETASPQANSQG